MKEINNRDELLAFVTGIDANTIVCPCRTRGYTLEDHADTDEMQIAGLGTANPVKVGMTAQKTLAEAIEFTCAASGKLSMPHFCEVYNLIASYVPQRKRNAIIRHYETPTPELIGIPSSLYSYLPMRTLLANVEAALDDTVASYRFVRATYDPWLTALYYDMELEDEHRQNLKEQYAFDGEPVRFSLTITTSDNGLACTSIHPILHVGSREIWLHGKGDSVSHIFNTHATPESKIRASAESIFAIARVGADQLSALFSIAVTHPAEVAYRIMKQLQIATKWTAMCTQSIYGRMQQGMDFTAADLVLEVSDYLEAYLSQNDVAEFRKLNFREDLCKILCDELDTVLAELDVAKAQVEMLEDRKNMLQAIMFQQAVDEGWAKTTLVDSAGNPRYKFTISTRAGRRSCDLDALEMLIPSELFNELVTTSAPSASTRLTKVKPKKAKAKKMMETRCVKWNRSMFHSADRSYCVGLYMDTTTKQFFTCCGAELPEGNIIYRFTGEEIEHKKYGKQFSVQSYEIESDSKTNLIAYLSSSEFTGIGKGTAKRIVKELGVADTRALVGGRIELIQNLSLSEKKKAQLESVLRSTSELTEVKRELMPYGVPEKLCKKLVSLYHEDAIAVVRRNPYILSVISEKVGFRKADEIGMKMGIVPDANVRIAAGIREILMQDTLRGHYYSLRSAVTPQTLHLLGISNMEKVDDTFEQLKQASKIVATEKVVYSKSNFAVESGIAKLLLRLWKRGETKPLVNPMLLDHALSDAEKQLGFSLPDKQREAVQTAISLPVTIITGGAGTGKTTILKAIQCIIDRHAKQFTYLFAAPTGKAARRISESTNSEASTIHRMLGLTEGSSEPMGLDADIIICDEASMIDAALFHKLLQGMLLGKAHHLILVGDVEQLPSVGAGAVLNDLIKSGQIPVVVLNTTYRQAKDSGIIENANLVRNGDTNIRFNNEDFIFVPCDSPEKIAEEVRKLYAQDPENTCVLAPRKGGIAGVNNLNNVLRESVNPLSAGGTEKQYGEYIFRVDDKVMQIKNTDDGLSNGDTGVITAIVQDEIKVTFDCGMAGSYAGDELDKIIPAYAMTIHKSQGSQFPTVILALSSSESRNMLKKNLLYTGITRAQQKVYIVGDEQAIRTAILTPDTSVRHTALDVRVRRAWSEA